MKGVEDFGYDYLVPGVAMEASFAGASGMGLVHIACMSLHCGPLDREVIICHEVLSLHGNTDSKRAVIPMDDFAFIWQLQRRARCCPETRSRRHWGFLEVSSVVFGGEICAHRRREHCPYHWYYPHYARKQRVRQGENTPALEEVLSSSYRDLCGAGL